MRLNNIILALLLLPSFSSFSQKIEKGYFMFPIKPGQVNQLSANMGELRPNHFHGGLDIKTDQKVGYPVYASADGYVSRIRASSYGYGYAVYITHPNHLVTVYAHLDKFNSAIGDYILKKQYEKQTFEIEVRPSAGELPVKKGEVIGLAGNSGGSQAPHLHYEIRDTTDRVLNPADCGFKEISDNIPPIFDRIAIVPMSIQSRVNGEFDRKEFKASAISAGNYILPGKISASGLIALEIKAYDRKNLAHNTYGVNHMKVFIDEVEVFRHNLSSFTFDETRYINEHINYQVFTQTGKRFEKLYISDGNKLSTYTSNVPFKGKFLVNNEMRKVKIILEDDFGNKSSIQFDVHFENSVSTVIPKTTLPNQKLSTEILENTLKISTISQGDPGAVLYSKGKEQTLVPAYMKNGSIVYLHDLRSFLPDSVKVGSQKQVFSFVQMVIPGQEQTVTVDNLKIRFSQKILADTLFFTFGKGVINGKQAYFIHEKSVSLYDTLVIHIHEDRKMASNCLAYCHNKGKPDCEEGTWNGSKIEFSTKNLGKFTILEDSVKPTIRYISNIGNCVKFTVFDDLSGIQSWKATLNGYWLLMNYDHKRNLMWSERLDKTVPLKGELIFELKDHAGNVNIFKMIL